ncbi:dynein axonemal intermediate chain 4 isoform X3 [Nyctibius grandis]|uniref:dynein axonemal intermediate chain 4 isoform X3 n=1 Tax=Nyctibius grandis TaxID=48427 RepID=UPI0035BC564F
MQGPGGGPRPSPVRKGSGTSCGSQRRASIISGIYANRARSRRQSTASDGKAAYRASLAANKIAVQVFDDEGKDVTPHPLFHSDPHTVVARQSKLLASSAYFGATGSISLSPFSMHQTPGVNASLGSLSRTYGSSSTSLSNASTTESIPDETLEPGSQQDTTVSLSGVQVRQEEVKEELTTDDLDRRVDIYLSETETIWILEMLPAVVSVESEAAGRVRERNRIYADICKTRPGNDRFVEKMMQTLNGAAKNKEVQCDKIIMEEKDPDVTSDTSGTAAAVKKAKQGRHDKGKKEKEEQKEAFVDPSILSDLNKTPEETVPPRLERLWSYICDLTNGHSVSSMAWSKLNPDLLAVGYGAFDFKEQKEGLACCWSLKNPMWPERIFRCEHGVTALDFSVASPNLLAVGMYDGSVAVYDVRSCKDDALLDSSESSNKHTGPVWQLRWVEQDRDATEDSKKEILICISADGQVTEWLIQKRLDCTDLMKIKRRESEKKKLPGRKERKCEVLVSQQAAGMCFDFHPKDTNYYLVGTEEGHIHKCSCSCNEQFLETYRGHKGPVHKVTWHPFSTDVFLSCSADWSIILWRQDSQTPVLTFTSTTAFVHDVMWSPKSAFIFAAAKESRVEIWDLSVSIFYPVISCFASPQGKFTSVLFAKNTDCLLAGDSEGEVSVFELQNLPAPYSNKPLGTWHNW